jgi:hypothetical protein
MTERLYYQDTYARQFEAEAGEPILPIVVKLDRSRLSLPEAKVNKTNELRLDWLNKELVISYEGEFL